MMNNKELREELKAAAKYIKENEVIHKKYYKTEIPSVIEYQGRRYVLDMSGKRLCSK